MVQMDECIESLEKKFGRIHKAGKSAYHTIDGRYAFLIFSRNKSEKGNSFWFGYSKKPQEKYLLGDYKEVFVCFYCITEGVAVIPQSIVDSYLDRFSISKDRNDSQKVAHYNIIIEIVYGKRAVLVLSKPNERIDITDKFIFMDDDSTQSVCRTEYEKTLIHSISETNKSQINQGKPNEEKTMNRRFLSNEKPLDVSEHITSVTSTNELSNKLADSSTRTESAINNINFLIAKGKYRGFVKESEIAAVLPKDISMEKIEEVFNIIESNGIELRWEE